MNGRIKDGLEAVLSFVNGQETRIATGDDLEVGSGLLLGKDWTDSEQMALFVALINDRVVQQIIEGTEEDEDGPKYEDVPVKRITPKAAMAIIYEALKYVEDEEKLSVLASNLLGDIGDDDLLLELAYEALNGVGGDYEGLQTLAKQMVVRVEKARGEEAVALLERAEALKAQAKTLEAQAANRADESAASAEKAAQLGKAGKLL